MLPKDMILITHILWRLLDGFQIKNHQPFCYFCRRIIVLWRFLCESLTEFKAWLTRKCINIKAQQVYDHNSAYLSAEQPFSRRGVCLLGDSGLALPHQMVVSSHMVEMVLWDLQEGAGVCWLWLHRRLWTLRGGEEGNGTRSSKACVPTSVTSQGKLLCCTLDQTGTAKPLNSATGSPELGKNSHLLINYFSIVYYFIFLGIFPWYNWD